MDHPQNFGSCRDISLMNLIKTMGRKATIRALLTVGVTSLIFLCLLEIANRRPVILSPDANIEVSQLPGALKNIKFDYLDPRDWDFLADYDYMEGSKLAKRKPDLLKTKGSTKGGDKAKDVEPPEFFGDMRDEEGKSNRKDDGSITFNDEDEALLKKGAQIRRVPKFNINGSDILVYVHIQKTGGTTFERHLVSDLDIYPKCQCKPLYNSKVKITCKCLNSRGFQWMWHRHSLGWPCGVHAGVTELWDNNCMEKWFDEHEGSKRRRNYHYATTLREPIDRFLSEWRMVQRGATWSGNEYNCGGRAATAREIRPCHTTLTWKSVSFRDFVGCKSNLAFNRQTRMMANLTLSDCYKLDSKYTHKQREFIMLQSAKRNLASVFQFVGFTEYQLESAQLFEHTFQGLHFNKTNFWVHNKTYAEQTLSMISPEQLAIIKERNKLDLELYSFAKELFLRRLKIERIKLLS